MRDDGGPAFPAANTVNAEGHRLRNADGVTLRDYFAATAMQGLLAAGLLEAMHKQARDLSKSELSLALSAYDLADAMLKARSK